MSAVTAAEPALSLSADEYLSLAFAADMLNARAADLADAGNGAIGAVCGRQAAILQGLHDRWHRAAMLANEGRLHDDDACAWCRTGAER